MIEQEIIFTSYISPHGIRMTNPVLVDRQLQEMRTVMKRMRQTQFVEEQSMSYLHELANNINGVGRQLIAGKKKVSGLRVVSRRMHAIHETSDPIITQKLNKIQQKS